MTAGLLDRPLPRPRIADPRRRPDESPAPAGPERVAGTPWASSYLRLVGYVRENGHALVPQQHRTADGYWLGKWVHNARQQHMRGRMPADLAVALEAVPGWKWTTRSRRTRTSVAYSAAWDSAYAALIEFASQHGHARPTDGDLDDTGRDLGQWAHRQRLLRLRGGLHPLREKLLNEVSGWSWETKARPEPPRWMRDPQKWDEGFGALMSYLSQHGHALVPQHHVQNGVDLGNWVHTQRILHRRGELPQPAADALAKVPGWIWNVHEQAWEDAFAELRKYASRHGHADVPASHVTRSGFRLGFWAVRQRVLFRGAMPGRHPLRPERARRLESLPGWSWDAPERTFPTVIEMVEWLRPRIVTLDAPLPIREDGIDVRAFLNRAKHTPRSAAEKTALESLPGWTWAREKDRDEQRWWAAYEAVAEWAARTGDVSLIPRSERSPSGPLLREWIYTQTRRREKDQALGRGGLSPEKQAAMERLPGFTWAVRRRPARPDRR